MEKRFYIEKLVVTGIGVTEASIKFDTGVNLIIGSSDTGKSYIYQCIDYLLGAGNCPKDIPQSAGYTECYLQIRNNEDKVFTIFRALKTPSKASIAEAKYENYATSQKLVLAEKNDSADGNNISEFLLKLMGVENVQVKTNAQNKTRKISFRDIARLVLIDETRIITEGSPVYTSHNNYYELTAEKSAFRFLLTENNDNELIEKEEKKVYESRIKGKKELIESLILSKNKLIEDTQNALPNINSEEINKKITELLEKLEASTKRVEELTLNREGIFIKLQSIKSNNLKNSELLKRFNLLRDHYTNDLSRLNFILEGDHLFKQLISKDCPVCGTLMDEEHLKCLAKNKENKVIGDSVKVEGQKIELKLKDLSSTITATETETKKDTTSIKQFEEELAGINKELNSELLPLQQTFKQEISRLISFTKSEQTLTTAKNDITQLYLEQDSLNKELQSRSKSEVATVDLEYTILQAFADHVEKYLRAWNFPGLTSVNFNNQHQVFDLTISGRGRNSHGKGVRAISYSAFTFGLLDYCIEESKPHSGFIVLDSPLTTYHHNQRREKYDEVSTDMQTAFFDDLKSIGRDRQIIILDNKVPPADLIAEVNYIPFSDSPNSLRKGFFPI